MRPHRRPGPVEHVLVAGGPEDLPAIRAVLGLLPDEVYGQVYVELPAGEPLPDLRAPARVTVAALPRAESTTAGSLLVTAIEAWFAEWMPDVETQDRAFVIWVCEAARNQIDARGAQLDLL